MCGNVTAVFRGSWDRSGSDPTGRGAPEGAGGSVLTDQMFAAAHWTEVLGGFNQSERNTRGWDGGTLKSIAAARLNVFIST